jgi:hypothetical protein
MIMYDVLWIKPTVFRISHFNGGDVCLDIFNVDGIQLTTLPIPEYGETSGIYG